MVTSLSLSRGPVDAAFWPQVADRVTRWLAQQGAPARDAIVLLPHSRLLGPARAAFALRGGWQPRIETAATLAAALAPPPMAAIGSPVGHRATDRLQAAALLRHHSPAAFGAQSDGRAFAAAVAAVVDTAHALIAAQALQPVSARPAWWQALRDALPAAGAGGGPGTTERWLARVALEWAATAEPPSTDALLALRPSAWAVLAAAGQDPAVFLPPADDTPRLHLQADGDASRPFDAAAALPGPRLVRAVHLEDEAAGAAQAVLEALDSGAATVGLVAQDRLVVRRLRALLERLGVPLDDETGWTLSTTRAAARLMAWLRAALPGAGRDACVEALRAEGRDAGAIDALESAWRGERAAPPAFASAVQARWAGRVERWLAPGPRTLSQWLEALREAAPVLLDALAADAAGRQVLDVVGLAGVHDAAWDRALHDTQLALPGFVAWVDDTLEGSIWRPTPAADARVTVVPLARAVLRPFDAVVFPGCDARRLGGTDALPGLLPGAVARAFGLIDAARRRELEALAFASLLRVPTVTLLRRQHEAGEPLAASPLVERAMLARRRHGSDIPDEQAVVLPRRRVEPAPVARPAPAMADALPASLSASAVQVLRDCPYRFFARSALRLRSADELDAGLDMSDYGRWVHALLHRFHTRRSGRDDRAELLAAADAAQAELQLDDTALWPYRAAFDAFAGHYLGWLAEHEAQGWRFDAGEVPREIEPPALGGTRLDGRLDRIDRAADGASMLIDYKTSRPEKSKERVRDPLEDTQLAVYAALIEEGEEGGTEARPPRAIYLSLGDTRRPSEAEHEDVAASAAALIEGLGRDLDALRGGTGAAALGEGQTCRLCEMRGLCRRDHWSDAT